MVTVVTFDESWTDGDKLFRTQGRSSFWVKSFKNGVVTVDVPAGATFDSYATIIAGCLKKNSNFKRELFRAFKINQDTPFKGIQFEFNGVTILATEKNANSKELYYEYSQGLEEMARKERLELEAYMKTPEYKRARAKVLKKEIRKAYLRKRMLKIDKRASIEFKDEKSKKDWQKWVRVNSKDGYSKAAMKFARRWAKYMQYLMKKHNKPVSLIANEAYKVCDVEGITGFMYGCAVGALSSCWKYGDDLKKWHNKEWGNEDAKGVVNPSIITLG